MQQTYLINHNFYTFQCIAKSLNGATICHYKYSSHYIDKADILHPKHPAIKAKNDALYSKGMTEYHQTQTLNQRLLWHTRLTINAYNF